MPDTQLPNLEVFFGEYLSAKIRHNLEHFPHEGTEALQIDRIMKSRDFHALAYFGWTVSPEGFDFWMFADNLWEEELKE